MNREELKITLGELEAEVMSALWCLREATVRQVLFKLSRKRKVAYTTVMTILVRLWEKGIVRRRQEDKNGAYVYAAKENKDDFFARVSGKVINNLLKNYGDVAVAQFIDVVENGRFRQTAEWRRRLKRLLR